MSESWVQLQYHVNKRNVAQLTACLEAQGALSVSYTDALDEPIYQLLPGETSYWNKTIVTGLFAKIDQSIFDQSTLDKIIASAGIEVFHSEQNALSEQNWQNAWKKYIKPMKFGNNLWVVPDHESIADSEAVILNLPPGQAFGTGTHATTHLCLEWLAYHPIVDKTLIDFGCGSGILAIAAAKLGAQHVYAVDHDAQAMDATLRNAQMNGVSEKITCYFPEQAKANRISGDILIANILTNPIITLMKQFANYLVAHGKIILSGILEEQASLVSKTYQPFFQMRPPVIKDGWVRIDGQRILREE